MNKKDISNILENWDLGKLISSSLAKSGVVNINYIIKTPSGKYILRKVVKSKTKEDLEFELAYLSYLSRNNFSYKIPTPIKTKNNEFFININGNYFWIYKYIEGKNITRFNTSQLRQVAKMMAEYHSLIEQSKLDNKKDHSPLRRDEILNEIKSFMNKAVNNNKKEKIFLKESLILIPIFKSLNVGKYSRIPKYPLHRDINPENTLWLKGKLKGIIDFENVSEIKETFIKDISGMLQYSCRDKDFRYKTDLRLAKLFLSEYKKYRNLSNEEISFLPDIITAGAIEDFAYAYWMLINDKKRAKLYRLKLYSRVAQWHYNNRDKIIQQLTWKN